VVLRRGELLLAVLVAQAAVGYSQYLTGDPVLLVGIHITGATAVVIAMLAFNLGLYAREPVLEAQNVMEVHKVAPELANVTGGPT
jgi:heme a synthase